MIPATQLCWCDMEMVPAVVIQPLTEIPENARIVIYNGKLTFVGNPEVHGSERLRRLAVYDSKSARFLSALPINAHDEVLSISGEYLIEPDLTSHQSCRLCATAGTALFIRGHDPCIAVSPGSSPSWRVFNLRNFSTSTSQETNEHAFIRWKLGVRGVDRQSIHWLLQI